MITYRTKMTTPLHSIASIHWNGRPSTITDDYALLSMSSLLYCLLLLQEEEIGLRPRIVLWMQPALASILAERRWLLSKTWKSELLAFLHPFTLPS